MPHQTVPGLSPEQAKVIVVQLEDRLVGSIDLQLVLKHIHWNVVGPNFMAVHELLDDQVAAVRAMTDAIAERIATLGGEPNGNSGFVVANRSWDDYPHRRASVTEHLVALDGVYDGVITDHRSALQSVGDIDPITEDLLIGQTKELELFQWFIRSHIENTGS